MLFDNQPQNPLELEIIYRTQIVKKSNIKRIYTMNQDYKPSLGDRIQLRKKHPCGNDIWQVVRLGADIGLLCEKCGRKVLLARYVLRRRVKQVLPKLEIRD